MGTNVLPERPNGVVMPSDWFNAVRQLVLGDFVPRNPNGIPTDLAGNLGTVLLQWNKLYAKEIFLNNQPLETTFLTGRSWRVEDGTKKSSGFPNYLVAAGVGNGLNCTIDTTDTFEALANGVSVSLASNTVFSSLTAAPLANKTCLINDTVLSGGTETKVLGELDSKTLSIDTIGSEISDRDQETAAFRTPTGEIFLAFIDTANGRLLPLIRGWAGTDRGALSDNDSLEYMQINTLLFHSDGNTKVSSENYPVNVDDFPVAGSAGNVYIKKVGSAQGFDDGSSIIEDYVIVGYAVCDDTDCLFAQQIDFDLSWNNSISLSFRIIDGTNIEIKRGSSSGIKSQIAEFFSSETFNTTTDLDGGQVLTNNTELFLYLKGDGSLTFSHERPRSFGFLLRGLYHPSEYYRAVGSVMLGGATDIIFKRNETPNIEQFADLLPPVGTIMDMVGSYFSNGSNGSPTNVFGSNVSEINSILPSGWRVCDGSELFDPESFIYRLVGRFLPNLSDSRFLSGSNSIGGIGGSATAALSTSNIAAHSHDISHGHSISNAAKQGHKHESLNLAVPMFPDGGSDRVLYRSVTHATGPHPVNASFSFYRDTGSADLRNFSESTQTSLAMDIFGSTDVENSGTSASIGPLSAGSGSTGSGDSFSIVPKFMSTIKIIKVK